MCEIVLVRGLYNDNAVENIMTYAAAAAGLGVVVILLVLIYKWKWRSFKVNQRPSL